MIRKIIMYNFPYTQGLSIIFFLSSKFFHINFIIDMTFYKLNFFVRFYY